MCASCLRYVYYGSTLAYALGYGTVLMPLPYAVAVCVQLYVCNTISLYYALLYVYIGYN